MAEPTADRRFACGFCGVDGYEFHRPACPMRDHSAKYFPGRNATGYCNECGAAKSQEHATDCMFFFRMGCCGQPPTAGHASWCDYKSPRNPMCDGCGAVRPPDGGPLVHTSTCSAVAAAQKAVRALPDFDHGQEIQILVKPVGPLPERAAVEAFFEWLDEQDDHYEQMRRRANGPNSIESSRAYHSSEVMKDVRKKFNEIFVSEVPW